MNLGQIYYFNAIMLTILTIILITLLFKKKLIALAIAFIISLIMTVAIFVPFCLEYTWTYYIMLIVSILAVIWNDNKKKRNILFFIAGMLTCFFDFLTTEIITVLVPMIIVLILQIKNKKIINIKQSIIFVIQTLFLWGISYTAMWFAKWMIASFVLKINAFDYVIEQARFRIDGQVLGKNEKLFWEAIKRNLTTLYLFDSERNLSKGLIILLIVEIILIRKKDMKKLWLSSILLMIGIIPYIRYSILANHSYMHSFFTFRSQMVTIIALILAMIYSIDFNFWKEQTLKIKKIIRRKIWN